MSDSGYNMPPGVYESDIPGNSDDDHLFQDQIESLWEILDTYGLESGFLDGFMANDNFTQKRDAAYERGIVTELSLWGAEDISQLLDDLESWAQSHGILKATLTTKDVRIKFNRLAVEWIKATGHMSSIEMKAMHPTYQQIIGMGPAVVPYILGSMHLRADHWFWALSAITGENPISEEDAGNVKKMTSAWLRLGRERGWV